MVSQIINLKYSYYEQFTNLHNIFLFSEKRTYIYDFKAKKSYDVKQNIASTQKKKPQHKMRSNAPFYLLTSDSVARKKMLWVQEIFSLEFVYMWKPCYVYFWLFKGRKHLVV